MKKLIAIYLLLICTIASAQNISVTDFHLDEMDQTANLQGTMVKDQNGSTCALIKVITSQTGFIFDVGVLGITKTEQKPGEIWLYVPAGIRKITITHPQIGQLRDHPLPVPIDKARTYIMRLESAVIQTIVKKDLGGNFYAISVEPQNAMLYVDDQPIAASADGQYAEMMPYGQHTYRVEAGGYVSKSGTFEVVKGKQTNITVKLESALATLNIRSTTEGSSVLVDKKKITTPSISLKAGMHLIQATKSGYRDFEESINLGIQQKLDYTIPALVPMYGTLTVNYKPLGADVLIDGKKAGVTPLALDDILACEHTVVITKDGYDKESKSITIKDNEISSISGELKKTPDTVAFSAKDRAIAKAKRMYAQGVICCVNKKYDKALPLLLPYAELGNADAQFRVAWCYEDKQSYEEAVKWYRKAAEQGVDDAKKALKRLGY